MRLFANNRTFTFSNLAALIHYSAVFAVSFLLSLYLQYVKGLTPQQAGLVLIFQPVVQFLFSPAAGRLSDRVEPRILASAGMMLTATGLFLLVFLSPATPLWAIVADLILLGFGYALFSSPNMNAIMGSVERKSYGVASGMLATMRLDRADAQHGDRDAPLRPVPWPRRDHAGAIPPLLNKREDGIRCICGSVCHWRVRLACQG